MNGIQEAPMSGDAPNASPITGIEKRCTKCGEIKIDSCFSLSKSSKDGLRSWCKDCCTEDQKKRYKANPEKEREYAKQWRKKNPEKVKLNSGKWAKRYPDKYRETMKKWYQSHKKEQNERGIKWREKNPERIKEISKKAYLKYSTTSKGRLNHRLSVAIQLSLKGNKKGRRWESLVNYKHDELKSHLEKQFTEGMTWERLMKGEIHIDHIIPKAAFNFEKPEDEDFKRCWALENLQPLWAKENIRKNNRLKKPFQPKLIFKEGL